MKPVFAITFFFLRLSISTFSQTADSVPSKNKFKKKFQFLLGAIYAPEYSFKTDKSGSRDWNDNANETAIYGYATGLGIKFIVRHLTIETGALFTKRGFEAKNATRVAIVPPKAVYSSLKYKLIHNSIETPLKIGYRFYGKKLTGNIFGGITHEVLWKVHYYERFPDMPMYDYNVNKRENLSAWAVLIGFGLNYQIGKRINISLEPTYLRYLNPLYIGWYGRQFYFYSYAIRAAIYISIR